MYTEIELFIGILLGCGFGITLVIVASMARQDNEVGRKNASSLPDSNFQNDVPPFIQVHRFLVEDPNLSSKEESLLRLREKVESFKHRNRFYQN